jgi:hypothetical protein
MNREEHSRVRSEDAEMALAAATSLVRTQSADPDVRVRLVVSEGASEDRIYHFDASSALLANQLRIIVRRAHSGRWEAVIDP